MQSKQSSCIVHDSDFRGYCCRSDRDNTNPGDGGASEVINPNHTIVLLSCLKSPRIFHCALYCSCCLRTEIVTLEDCLLERRRRSSAKLHFQSRKTPHSTISDRPASSTQTNVREKELSLARLDFFSHFLRSGEAFPLLASLSCQDVGSRVCELKSPAKGAGQFVRQSG